MANTVILFGDQTVYTSSCFHSLQRQARCSTLLQRFMTDATLIVKREVQTLDPGSRARFYDFRDLVDLADQFNTIGHPDDLVATILMTVAQLGELILQAEDDASILNNDQTVVLGLCTGVIPAAVCAYSKGLKSMLHLALKAVSLAFNFAVESGRRSQAIEDSPGYWAYSIVNVAIRDLEYIIDGFHTEKCIPLHRYAYLSVVADTWATISGPPTTLDELFAYSEVLESAPKLRLPFGAAAHAPHLPRLSVDALLDASSIGDEAIDSRSRLFSTSTCAPHIGSSIRDMFREALGDVASRPLSLSDTLQGVIAALGDDHEEIRLLPIGPLGHTNMVQRTLQRAGLPVNVCRLSRRKKVPHGLLELPDIGAGDNIAIVGMSGRFPGSESVGEFWQCLLDQKAFHTRTSTSHSALDIHPDLPGCTQKPPKESYRSVLERPGVFDHRMFNISPQEALRMGPLQRLSLLCAYEALEMAGYSPDGALSTRTACIATFFGQALDGNGTNVNESARVYFLPSSQRAFVPGRLNHQFGWGGPSYSVDTACTSSLSAVSLAVTSLTSGQCDMAVAGGASILPILADSGSKDSGFAPKDSYRSMPGFSDGCCYGEGVGVVIMKRYEDAVADNDNLLAVIRGTARNSGGTSTRSHPSSTVQCSLYRDLLHQTQVDPSDIGYVEMHGTATQANDIAEVTSLAYVFGEARLPDSPLYMGGVKANVGHGGAAAGMASLIKSVMMLRERVIPGQPKSPPGHLTANQSYPPLHHMGVQVVQQQQEFGAPESNDRRKILINNFDAAGGNVSLLLEEHVTAPPPESHPAKDAEARNYHVITISAHTPKAFIANKQSLLAHLTKSPTVSLKDLAYTTTARRVHHQYRRAYIADSLAGLTKDLARDSDVLVPLNLDSSTQPSIVFSFTGQGHGCRTMGTKLYHTSASFRKSIDSYHRLCESYRFDSFLGLITGDIPADMQPSVVQTQLATVSLELALLELWKDWGVRPSMVIGHGLGEYAALCAAGVLSVNDTLYLVGTSASLLHLCAHTETHAMLSLGIGLDDSLSVLERFPSCEVACVNTPTTTVVSGPIEAIVGLKTLVKSEGHEAARLATPYAFHSEQINPILGDFMLLAQQIQFAKPSVPVASTLSGSVVVEDGLFNIDYLLQQVRDPVDFVGALNALQSSGLLDESTHWVECGPHPESLGFAKETLNVHQDRLLPSLQSGQDDWNILCSTAATLHTELGAMDWTRFHQENASDLKLLELPSYCFDLDDFGTPLGDRTPRSRPEVAAVETKPGGQRKGGIGNLLTSSLQTLEQQDVSETCATWIFSSAVSEPELAAAMAGQATEGHALCPAGVFLDMALSAARYVFRSLNPDTKMPSFSAYDMDITQPLVLATADAGQDQTIVVTATRAEPSRETTAISFASSQAGRRRDHGTCTVGVASSRLWARHWQKTGPLVNLARQGLLAAVGRHLGHRLSKSIVYKLFSHVVKYSASSQTLEDVIVAEDFTQGFAQIRLGASTADSFMHSAYWADGLGHLASFLVNCDPAKSDTDVWVPTGFRRLHLAETLCSTKTYTAFVSFGGPCQAAPTALCDVYLFDGTELLGMASDFKFTRMDRASFGALVPTPAGGSPCRPPEPKAGRGDRAMLAVSHRPLALDIKRASPRTLYVRRNHADQPEGGPTLLDVETQAKSPSETESQTVIETLYSPGSDTSPKSPSVLSAETDPSGYMTPSSSLGLPSPVDGAKGASSLASPTSSPQSSPTVPSAPPPPPRHSSRAVLLQGRERSPETPLFLMTDGTGCATAYMHLPGLPRGRAVYAVESPFLHAPGAFAAAGDDDGIDAMAARHAAEVRRLQPRGPYLLGGWAEGAVFAYEVARRLLEAGEEVRGLVLVDMGVPAERDAATTAAAGGGGGEGPAVTMAGLEASGWTAGIDWSHGGGAVLERISLRLKEHLLAVCRALAQYQPQAMGDGKRPHKTYMIWARRGLTVPTKECDGKGESPRAGVPTNRETSCCDSDDKPGGDEARQEAGAGMMSWAMAPKTSFGSNGWEALVGADLTTRVVDADHFSMMAPPHAAVTGGLIRQAVEECCA